MKKFTLIILISVVSILSTTVIFLVNGNPEAWIGLIFVTPYLFVLTNRRLQQDYPLAPVPVESALLHANGKQATTVAMTGKMQDTVQKIKVLMEAGKMYQEPELTLQQLAEKLELPAYQVSLILNEVMQKSFYDLVNGHRVDEAKRLLLDRKNLHFTILSVGFEAGFNSKTTFNTVFKKFTGYTPTEYREIHGMVREAA